ncbi:MAG TPA: NYN domain-containing protein, partial [Chitinophagales bacterium]|nr:NYN domain-containing protein [Chitinophagales bacterium]
MNTQENFPSVALLIDGDNVSTDLLPKVLGLAAQYGNVAIKRVYADFTQPQHACWKNAVFEYGLKPIQSFNFAKGKNTTDIAMVMDAMDLMCAKKAPVFCLASSDSDFTQLAVRLRENNITVIGIGRFSTMLVFKKACNWFHHLDDVSNNTTLAPASATVKETNTETAKSETVALTEPDQKQIASQTQATLVSPTLSGLTIVGIMDRATLDSRLNTKKGEPKILTTLKPDASTVNRPFTPDFISRFTQVFNKIANPNTQTVLMSRLG